MIEATFETTIKSPDEALFRLIAKYDDLSTESAKFDEEAVQARRTGELARAKELSKRCDEAFNHASALFWELIHRDAVTAQGYAAKMRMIAGSEFDNDDMISIAWTLGHEAGRLGLGKAMPRLKPQAVQRMSAAE